MKRIAFMILGCLFGTIPIFGQEMIANGLVADGAQLEEVGHGFAFTEGPAVDRDGNVYFTDQPNNRIWKYDITTDQLSVYMESAGRANGLFFDKNGNLIACADEKNELWRISGPTHVDKLVKNYRDSLLNGPNDVWVAPKGTIYFTDPYYQRDYWTRTSPDLHVQALYCYGKDEKLEQLDTDFIKPNGLVGTADGKTLYVADIGASNVYRYRIQKDGALTEKTLFVTNQRTDGMTIDSDGRIYLAGNGITVYDTEGVQVAHIPVPAKWTANVCFAGKLRDMLFITAGDKVFTLRMNTKGVK